MSLLDYLAGVGFFVATFGSVLLGAGLIVRRRLPHLTGAPRALAFATVAVAALIAVHLLPGLVGLLSRPSVLVCAIALAAVASRLPAVARAEPAPAPPPAGPSGRASSALAGIGVAVLSVWLVATAWSGTATPPGDGDTLTFHLPNVAKWIQSGTFWRVDQFTPLQANGNYPQSGDVVSLGVTLPWHSDILVRTIGPLFVGVTALALYAVARELRAPWSTAVLAAVTGASLPIVLLTAATGGQTDTIMYAMFGAGLLFLLRHLRTGRCSELVLAGIALGIAFGTKWYGVTAVPILVGCWGVALLLAHHPLRRVAIRVGAVAGLVAVVGGFWLIRNLVESGDPFYPVAIRLFGITLFGAPPNALLGCVGASIAHYAGSLTNWRHFLLPAYRLSLSAPGALLLAGSATALVVGVRRSRRALEADRDTARVVVALAAAVALLALAYVLTPTTALGLPGHPIVAANTRYSVPALIVATPLAAWAVARLGRARLALEGLALLATLDGVRRADAFSRAPLGRTVLALAVVGLIAVLAVLAVRGARRLSGQPALAARIATGILVVIAVIGIGEARQRRFVGFERHPSEPALAWIAQHAPAGHDVGLAGLWAPAGSPVLASFGPRLGNDVSFNGRVLRGQLREFENRRAWTRAVRRRGYDLLLVGNVSDQQGCGRLPGKGTDDNAWARADRFQLLARSSRLTLYRVR